MDLKKAILLHSSQSRAPLVELENVEHAFGEARGAFKLGPVNLNVPQGQIIGVVGPNGSGKTTLLRVIAADLLPSSGNVDFRGVTTQTTERNMPSRGRWAAIKSRIAYVRPSPDLFNENTELALWITYGGYALVLICHELDDGAEFLERATIANPNLAIAWTYRGYANIHLGRPEEAIDYFKKALRLSPLDPLDFATQKGLADVYFFAGQHAEALKWSLSYHSRQSELGACSADGGAQLCCLRRY